MGTGSCVRLLHFSCPQGHRWKVECDPFRVADPVSDPCPICRAPGASWMPSESADETDPADELPPAPSPSVRLSSDGRARLLWSDEQTRDRSSLNPPQIAGYEILGELGRGGMGVVYHARQLNLGRDVALKIVLAGAHAGWNERSRLRVEAETVASMKHPNIVPIYEVGEQDNLPYLALELVEGGSLAQALAIRPMASEQAAGLAETLAQAVRYVHGRGIVHRDLKPANVLLTVDGIPKITDFGLAKCLDASSGHTKSGMILGTPGYMAPEQAKGQSSLIGPATDIYALGAILYEMLTGRPPFHAASAQETVQQLLTEEPVSPSRLQPRVSRDLETICLKCLQKEPGQTLRRGRRPGRRLAVLPGRQANPGPSNSLVGKGREVDAASTGCCRPGRIQCRRNRDSLRPEPGSQRATWTRARDRESRTGHCQESATAVRGRLRARTGCCEALLHRGE